MWLKEQEEMDRDVDEEDQGIQEALRRRDELKKQLEAMKARKGETRRIEVLSESDDGGSDDDFDYDEEMQKLLNFSIDDIELSDDEIYEVDVNVVEDPEKGDRRRFIVGFF